MSAKVKQDEAPEQTDTTDTKGIRVFVYGTLKRLHYNHEVIESDSAVGTQFLGACFIEGPYQMRDLGSYPGVQQLGDSKLNNRIYGEVYKVTEATLKGLDILEGNGHFFTRSHVETPWKKAWCYMIPVTYAQNRPIIPDGVWKPNSQEKQFIYGGKPFLTSAEYFAMDFSN